MNPETMLRQELREWADEARVPHDLADRALRHRRGRRGLRMAVLTAGATAAVTVAALLTVPGALRDDPARRDEAATATTTSDPVISPAPAEPAATDVRTDTENSPPRNLIAAGRIAVSAYYVWRNERLPGGRQRTAWTWYLYDPRTETYQRTGWSWLDVSPGLRYAAVLEGELPSRRVGIVDVATREVLRWIDLDQPVMRVLWSPDGTRLLTTAYDTDPTIVIPGRQEGSFTVPETYRLGFHVVDVNAGRARFHAVPSERPDGGLRPFVWTPDGNLIMDRYGGRETLPADHDLDDLARPEPGKPGIAVRAGGEPVTVYYDLDGRVRPEPAELRLAARAWQEAGLSPDGTMYADSGAPPGPETTVRDVRTGEVKGVQRMLQLVAWADNENLIAWGCAGGCSNEFNNALVLVSVDGRRTVQLSAYRANSQRPGSWGPLLTRR